MSQTFGAGIVRDVFARGTQFGDEVVSSWDYNDELAENHSTSLVTQWGKFAASTAFWTNLYPDVVDYPDVRRHHVIHVNGPAVRITLDDMSYELMTVDYYTPAGDPVSVPMKAIVTIPALGYASYGFSSVNDGTAVTNLGNTTRGGKLQVVLSNTPDDYTDAGDDISFLIASGEYLSNGSNAWGPQYYDNQVYTAWLTTDFTAPNTSITRTSGRKGTRKFSFKANQSGSTFTCKMDIKSAGSCRSGKTYRHLKRGRHTFRVWAKDINLNDEKQAGAAVKSFRIR
jgi:hypothetical protein